MSTDVVIYKCVICGKSFSKRQSLAAHLGHHKDVEFAQFNVRIPKARRDWIVSYCQRHNTTTCHLLLAFCSFLEEGEKHGNIILGSPNPTFFVLQEYFMAKPRGHGKYDTTSMMGFEPEAPSVYCVFCGGFSGGLVFCQRYGSDWLPASRCADCPSNWFKKKGG
jgi:hypothetical protein